MIFSNFLFIIKFKRIKSMQEKESKTNSHFYISVVKSVFRIIACYYLFNGQLGHAAIGLGLAEVLGIAEEIF